ncbi:TlpA family protein disulfide reductase [Brevibacillus dissolubilis]|uniref:TlpA family protein disulfide reductase n=1 Tax=Brevibacillus dissolubilis TaxID=1844116 RepID=UPI0011168C06|nr:TlpA disulfide reductase family protein [Brevibacillus dissolubilis]
MKNAILALFVLAMVGFTVYSNMSKQQAADAQQVEAPGVYAGQESVQVVDGSNQVDGVTTEQVSGESSGDSAAGMAGIAAKADPTKPLAEVGHYAPSFSLHGADQKIYEFKGKRDKPLVVNFWASWCGPCEEEAPELQKAYEQYKDKVDIWAVNLLASDDMDAVGGFVQKHGMTMPILFDSNSDVADQYRILAIPTTFFIDKNGVIRHKLMGGADAKAFGEMFEKLLEE